MKDMAKFETDYDKATRRVMQTVARVLAKRPLPVRLEDGTSPIVVALPSDSVATLDARLARAGGSANIFVAYPEKLMLVAARDEHLDDDVADIHPDSTVDMMILWLKSTPKGTGSIRVGEVVADAPRVEEMEYAF